MNIFSMNHQRLKRLGLRTLSLLLVVAVITGQSVFASTPNEEPTPEPTSTEEPVAEVVVDNTLVDDDQGDNSSDNDTEDDLDNTQEGDIDDGTGDDGTTGSDDTTGDTGDEGDGTDKKDDDTKDGDKKAGEGEEPQAPNAELVQPLEEPAPKASDEITLDKVVTGFQLTGPDKELSGSTQSVRLGYGIVAGDAFIIEDGQLEFRISLPDSVSVGHFPSQDGMLYKEVTGDDGTRYISIVFENAPDSGTTEGITLNNLIFAPNGTTADGTEVTLQADIYYDGEFVSSAEPFTHTVLADKFEWNDVSVYMEESEQNKGREHLIELPLDEYSIPDLVFYYNASSKNTSAKEGLVYAKSAVFTDTFTVPANADGIPQLLIPVEDGLALNDGVTLAELGEDDVYDIGGTKYFKRFTLTFASANEETITRELSISHSFGLNNVKVNEAAIDTNIETTLELTSASTGGSVVAMADVDVAGLEDKTQAIAVQDTKLTIVIPSNNRDFDSEKAPKLAKRVTEIDGHDENGNDTPYKVWAGDVVKFTLDDFRNDQKYPMQEFTLTDPGFDTAQLEPMSVYVGTFNNSPQKVNVIVALQDGTTILQVVDYDSTIALNQLHDSERKAINPRNIKSVSLEYGEVPAGFSPNQAPHLTFKTLKQSTTEELEMKNEAQLDYTYNNGTETPVKDSVKASASVFYQAQRPTVGSKNKSVKNLSTDGQSGVAHSAGDILEFTITLENNSGQTWNNLKVIDTFSDTLKPYTSDTNATNNIANFKVTSPASGLTFSSSTVDGNTMTVLLNGAVAPGARFTMTYTMQVQEYKPGSAGKALLKNEFDVYAHINYGGTGGTGGTGGGTGEPGDPTWVGGGHYGEEFTDDGQKPIVSFSKSITKINDKDGDSGRNMLEEGDTVTFKLSLENNRKDGETFVTVDAFTDKLDTRYLEYVKDSAQLVYSGGAAPSVAVSSAGKIVNDDYLVFKLDTPIELKPGEKLELTLNTKVKLSSTTTVTQWFTNTGAANIVEEKEKYHKKNGDGPVDDGSADFGYNNWDNNPSTKSRITSSPGMNFLNHTLKSGLIEKKITSSPLIDVSSDALTRTYQITLKSDGKTAFTISSVADVLPRFESYVEGSAQMHNSKDYTKKQIQDPVTSTIGSDEESRQKLLFANEIEMEPGIVGKQRGTYSVVITYQTKVNAEDATAYLRAQNKKAHDDVNKAAMFVKGELDVYNTQTADSDNWDDNADTSFRYQTSANVKLKASAIIPKITIAAQKISVAGGVETYSPILSSDKLTPGTNLGWRVDAYNTSTDASMKNPQIVVVLPGNLAYKGVASVSGITQEELGEPEISTVDGNTVLKWSLGYTLKTSGHISFNLKTTTPTGYYGDFAADAYLVPQEYFYKNGLDNPSGEDLSEKIPGQPDVAYVVDSDTVNVTGEFGSISKLTITEKANTDNTTNSDQSNRVISLPGKESVFEYTMRVLNKSADKDYKQMVLINRLPAISDKGVASNYNRQSDLGAQLAPGGAFNVIVRDADGTPKTLSLGDDYTLQYSTTPGQPAFGQEDWAPGEGSSLWVAADAVANKADVRAFRVVLAENCNVKSNEAVEIVFDALLRDENLKDNGIAYDSFGYSARIELYNKDFSLIAEPRKVGVQIPFVNGDRVAIRKVLNHNTTMPLDSQFSFVLIGTDIDGQIGFRQEVTVAEMTRQGTIWIGDADILLGLPHGLTYSITELKGGLRGIYTDRITLSKTEKDGGTLWHFVATNTPVPTTPTTPGGGGSGGGGGGDGIDYTTIVDEPVPLFPGLVTLLDEDVPLGNLPKTGSSAPSHTSSPFIPALLPDRANGKKQH